MSELKPCPFCGGEAFIEQFGNEHTPSQGFTSGCKRCRIIITNKVIQNSIDWLRPIVVANWNRRTSTSAEKLEKVREKLKDLHNAVHGGAMALGMSTEEFEDGYDKCKNLVMPILGEIASIVEEPRC